MPCYLKGHCKLLFLLLSFYVHSSNWISGSGCCPGVLLISTLQPLFCTPRNELETEHTPHLITSHNLLFYLTGYSVPGWFWPAIILLMVYNIQAIFRWDTGFYGMEYINMEVRTSSDSQSTQLFHASENTSKYLQNHILCNFVNLVTWKSLRSDLTSLTGNATHVHW
jgi:hypothetical protein